MKVQGSKVLLTGANGGIGRAFVDELLRRDVVSHPTVLHKRAPPPIALWS